MTGGGRRGRVAGYLGCPGGLESVRAAHIHHKGYFQHRERQHEGNDLHGHYRTGI